MIFKTFIILRYIYQHLLQYSIRFAKYFYYRYRKLLISI